MAGVPKCAVSDSYKSSRCDGSDNIDCIGGELGH